MYDVELAYMVISHAQRDPGEYLLELQGFAGRPSTALTRHAIDVHLRRWDRALQHLLAAGGGHFGDALALAQSKVGCMVLCVSVVLRAETVIVDLVVTSSCCAALSWHMLATASAASMVLHDSVILNGVTTHRCLTAQCPMTVNQAAGS